jgi:hypothetical protein
MLALHSLIGGALPPPRHGNVEESATKRVAAASLIGSAQLAALVISCGTSLALPACATTLRVDLPIFRLKMGRR